MSIDTTMSAAISGLHANAVRAGTAAFNVVNANTEGFKARSVNVSSVVPVGVTASVATTGRTVDVAQEFVGMIQAEVGYAANAQVIKAAEQMTGSLLDLLA